MRSSFNLLRIQVPIWLVFGLMFMVLVFGAGSGYLLAQARTPATSCQQTPEVCADFEIFWQAWDLAQNRFVDPDAVDAAAMTEGAINGMLDSLGDQGHTRFLSAEDAQRWQESLSGEFEGIGAYLNVRDGVAIIVRPIEGSPAEQAGLLAGDIILAVDGSETDGMTIDEVVTRVRGPKGTSVTLTVLHPGAELPVDVDIQRNRIEVPNVTWRMLPNDVAFIQLSSFSERATEELQDALTQAQNQGARELILDLRNNPGGFLNEAIGVASQFLPKDTPVLIEEDRADNRTTTTARSGGVALDMPMVVLVNINTASSAEIVSGALQDAGRAEIIGVPTTGTGTVLTTFTLTDGSRVLLGTSQWRTPGGRLIRETGIEPDVEVVLAPGSQPLSPVDAAELSAQAIKESDDTQLIAALEMLERIAQP